MNREERDFDEKMKKKLKEEYQIDEIRKESIWNRIDSQLEFKPERKKNHYWKPIVASAAACLLLAIGLTSEQGSNIVNNIKESFVPQKEAQNINGSSGDNQGTETSENNQGNAEAEDNKTPEEHVDVTEKFASNKDVEIELEGIKETVLVVLHESPTGDYVIYIDEKRYKMLEDDGDSFITTKEPLPEEYPEVFMRISHDDRSVDQSVADLEKELNITFEQTDWPRPSYVGTIIEGHEYNSIIHRYYVLSDNHDGSYIVHQQLFGVAEEGHGVRLDYLLKDFHIIK